MNVKNKLLRISIIILIILIFGLMIDKNSYAWEMPLEDFENGDAGRAGNTVTSVIGATINLVSTVAAGVAIIMLIVIGLQYIYKGPEGKAEAKKDLTGYVIGSVILFGVSGILKLLQMFIDKNLNDKVG